MKLQGSDGRIVEIPDQLGGQVQSYIDSGDHDSLTNLINSYSKGGAPMIGGGMGEHIPAIKHGGAPCFNCGGKYESGGEKDFPGDIPSEKKNNFLNWLKQTGTAAVQKELMKEHQQFTTQFEIGGQPYVSDYAEGGDKSTHPRLTDDQVKGFAHAFVAGHPQSLKTIPTTFSSMLMGEPGFGVAGRIPLSAQSCYRI